MKLSRLTSSLASMALLAATVVLAGGCAEGNATADRSTYSRPWYGGYFPHKAEPMPAPAPAPAAAPAPAPVGTCANYRPAITADHSLAELSFPTGDKRSSALMLQQVMPKQVRAGANYEMEVHVTNITAGTLQNVVVTDESMDNMTIVSSTPPAGRGASGNAQWSIGDLGPCKTTIIKITAKADKVGNATNCLSVSYNNTLCSALQVVQPALQLTKTMTSEAMVCDAITATIEVKNTGTGAAENVVIKDNLPAGLTTADGKQSVELAVGTLAGGQSATRTMQLKATKKGRFENNATASATGGLSANSNTVAVVVKQPELAISIKCPERVFLGRDAKYDITVANKGDAVCNNTTLVANIAGGTFKSASDGGTANATGANWNLGSIPAGGTKTVSVTLGSGAIGTASVSATANCACASPVTADCKTDLQGIPAILVECVDDPDPIEVGGNTVYTITVTNQGSAPGTGIKVLAEMAPQQDFVSGTGTTAVTAAGKTITMATLPTLAPKATATWRVTVKANAAADVRFRIKVTSDQFSNPIEETESTNLYQ
ncbi:MAG: DUF11 domain-containing protein [Phycisphaerae bacterium]|nr:DUF11 domain-containing protein [Phycisphaerae bacterium]